MGAVHRRHPADRHFQRQRGRAGHPGHAVPDLGDLPGGVQPDLYRAGAAGIHPLHLGPAVREAKAARPAQPARPDGVRANRRRPARLAGGVHHHLHRGLRGDDRLDVCKKCPFAVEKSFLKFREDLAFEEKIAFKNKRLQYNKCPQNKKVLDVIKDEIENNNPIINLNNYLDKSMVVDMNQQPCSRLKMTHNLISYKRE